MTAPTPIQPDPRPASRPAEVAGGKAHWDALTTEAVAVGGIKWQDLRDGAEIRNIREAELLPVDANRTDEDVEQAAPPV